MPISRRAALGSFAGLPLLALVANQDAFAQDGPKLSKPQPYWDQFVRNLARALAAKPFKEATVELPSELAGIGYDQYRDIQLRAKSRLWRQEGLPFKMDLFHPGFLYETPVDVHVVQDGQTQQVLYDARLFDFGPNLVPPLNDTSLPFAGIRLRHPLNALGVWDEFVVFQGASYFRAVARNQVYGLSARGLAIGTASPRGEEFPAFRAFWAHRPAAQANSIVVDALLDSPSAAASYRFVIWPGAVTRFEVELFLYPRVELDHIGFAPLTSMFLFNGSAQGGFDDFRRAVHHSDGLAVLTNADEWLWRPLANPQKLQVSAFVDEGPRGFGLMQRARRYDDFLDLEAGYEHRPSCWVEPIGHWGAGHVELVEIPTETEYHDNIVAYWRPQDPIPGGSEHHVRYRLHWCDRWPAGRALARAASTAQGQSSNQGRRLFVVDFVGGPSGPVTADIAVSAGEVANVLVQPNTQTGGQRLTFELDPKGEDLVELRAVLKRATVPISETWIYRWTAS